MSEGGVSLLVDGESGVSFVVAVSDDVGNDDDRSDNAHGEDVDDDALVREVLVVGFAILATEPVSGRLRETCESGDRSNGKNDEAEGHMSGDHGLTVLGGGVLTAQEDQEAEESKQELEDKQSTGHQSDP